MKVIISKILDNFGYKISKIESKVVDKNPFSVKKQAFKNEKNLTIFDVGANIGGITNKYLNYFPDSTIHCFEADKSTYNKLIDNVKNTKKNKIQLINKAVSNKSGKIKFNYLKNKDANSILDISEEHPSKLETSNEVNSITLDDYTSENNVSKIDILKMDIQGAEMLALQGAKKLLSNNLIKLIYIEIIFLPTYKELYSFGDYELFLKQYNFNFIDFYDTYHKGLQLYCCDVIFAHDSIRNNLL